MAEEELGSRRELGSSWSQKCHAHEKSAIFYKKIEKNMIGNFDLNHSYARQKTLVCGSKQNQYILNSLL